MSNVIPFEYQGQPVQFSGDGWINATDVAKRFDRKPIEWLRLPATERYMKAMATAMGLKSEVGKSHFGLVATTRGGKAQGTWIHPKLAVHFARWLDDDFAVWCDLHIDSLLRGEINIQQQYDKAQQALSNRREQASEQGRGLAYWRYHRQPLEDSVEYWRHKLQLSLPLETH